jgi:hypothetical protein
MLASVSIAGVVAVGLPANAEAAGSAPAAAGPSAAAPSVSRKAEGGYLAVLDDPSWTLDYVSTPSEDGTQGELGYTSGKSVIELRWTYAKFYGDIVKNRREAGPGRKTRLLGERAIRWDYNSTDHTTIRKPAQGYFIEFSGYRMSRAKYRALLGKLRLVSVDGLEASLPEDFLTTPEMPQAARDMLAGITSVSAAGWPAGHEVDVSSLVGYTRYNLGARVAGNYACAWLDELQAAGAAGDAGRAAEAARVLGTAHAWPVLQEMTEHGAYSQRLWNWTDEGATGHMPATYDRHSMGCL